MSKGSARLTRQRERICWEMDVRGYTYDEIRRALDEHGLGTLSDGGIYGNIQRRGQRVSEIYLDRHDWMKSQQIERLNAIYQESMAAYRRSIQPFEQTTRTVGRIHVTRTGEVIEVPEQVQVARNERDGNPAFLKTAMDALQEIRKIAGLDAPKRTDVTSDGAPIKAYIGIDLDRV